jgi:flavin reductase (DIM6/NTAB) family NADH-FMN oxidoreductase RutF
MKVDPSRLHRLFYPQVPLVLAAKHGKRVSAMPVVSYAQISESPPLVAVACDPKAFTYKLTSKAGAFSLSLLDSSELRKMETLAKVRGGDVVDKLREVGLRHSVGEAIDVPVVDDAVATIECSVESKNRKGDHVLLVGTVRACYATEEFNDFWAFRRYRPILYTGWRNGMTVYRPGVRRRPD